MRDVAVDQVRRFNRTVTEQIGALDERYLGRDRPLGEARVLWEIGGGIELRALRARLGLDSGYLSRILRALEGEGLVRVEPSRDDRRVRRARLTRTGAGERRALDRLSDRLAASLLERLPPRGRDRLVAAMGEVERLLAASLVEIAVEPPESRDAVVAVQAYYAELDRRFDGGFTPDRAAAIDPADFVPPAGVFLLARLRGEPVGCGSLRMRDGRAGEIKRVWIADAVRGAGVGRRLLDALERWGAEHGARVVRLDTNRALVEAIQMYRAADYRVIPRFNDEPYAHHWFAKRVQKA